MPKGENPTRYNQRCWSAGGALGQRELAVNAERDLPGGGESKGDFSEPAKLGDCNTSAAVHSTKNSMTKGEAFIVREGTVDPSSMILQH